MTTIVRRRSLGRKSCRGITEHSEKPIRVVRSDKKLPEDGLYIRWGCTANVPSRNVVNTAAAIHEVSDKLGFRRKLNEAELCPPTWFYKDHVPEECLRKGVIVRPARHAGGKNLYLCNWRDDLDWVVNKPCMGHGYYISQFIEKVAEYRVYIASGRVLAVAEKIPEDKTAIAWNHAKGSSFTNVKWDVWPLKAVRTSVEAFNLSALDFGGVDVIVAEDGSCYVLEINSAPSLTSPYRQKCMAKAFDWFIEHGKERIPLIEERGGYRKFIHPCITEKALICAD